MKKFITLFLCFTMLIMFTACDTGSNSTNTDETTKPTTTENSATEPSGEIYTSGKYKVGIDIPAGEYFLECTSSFGGYMAICSDSNGEDILQNENFDTHIYITIEDGQYLELSRAEAKPVEDVSKSFESSNLSEGMYRVGIDIPAGEYKLTCSSEVGGYVCIYDNSSANQNIISNNNFDSNDYVTVVDGQYLLLNRCTGSIVQ